MKGMKSKKLLGTALLGLGLLGAALAQGVTGMTIQNEMSAQSQVSLWVQGKVGRAPNPSYPTTSSVRTRLASTPKSAATLLAGYWHRSGVLEGFAIPGQHSIDYGCDVVGIVFSVNVARGGVRREGWPGLPHLCARLGRK